MECPHGGCQSAFPDEAHPGIRDNVDSNLSPTSLHSRDDSISTMFPKIFFFFCGSILKVTNLDPSQ